MTDEAEARHVGGGMNVELQHRSGARGIELRHRTNGGLVMFVGERIALERSQQNSGAERLAQHDRIADSRADIADDSPRIDHASDRHAEFRFFVADGVAAYNYDPGLARFLCCPAQNLG